MAQFRCMYFDESGNPQAGGCHSKNCNFIHPGDINWDTTPMSRNTPRGRGLARGASFGESRSSVGRGRGRGYDSSNSTSALVSGWDTGGSDNGPKIQTGNTKDDTGWGDISGGWASDEPKRSEPTGTGWGESSGDWWADSGQDSAKDSGGGWGASSGSGWGSSSRSGWGASGATETMKTAQEKRDRVGEKDKSISLPVPPPPRRPFETKIDTHPAKLTGTNQIPMTNTKWIKRSSTTPSLHTEPPQKHRVSPVQTSLLSNLTPEEPSNITSAGCSEDDHMDLEKWLQKPMPENSRSGSPSISTVTGSSTANRKRKNGDSAFEQKQEIWKDFIRLFDRAVRAKRDFTKAEADRQSWRRTQKSAMYSRISDAGRNHLDGHRSALERACKSHSDRLAQSINELAEAGQVLKSDVNYDVRYDIGDEVTNYLREVGAWLSDIRPLLIANTSHPLSNTDRPTPDEDSPLEEVRPASDGLDPLRSRLDKQEELLEELRTALTLESSSRNDIGAINRRIDQKIDALRGAREEAKAQLAKLPPPKVDIPSEAMGAIECLSRKATELSMAMEKPVNDIAHLLIHQDEIKKAHASVKTENEELRESLARLTEKSATNRKLIQAQTEAIQRLKASVEAASESRCTLPAAEPPVKVMFQDLHAAVDDMVQGIVLREVVPAVTQLSDACRSENQRIHREVFEAIWDRIEPALKLTESVNRWVTRLDHTS